MITVRTLIFAFPFSIAVGVFSLSVYADNIWDELSQENIDLVSNRALSPELEKMARERIDYEKKRFSQSSWHLSVLQRRADTYAPYILRQCSELGIPLVIALVPMVESSYDPFALSQDGAAGLWQLMPSTAVQLGVDINWWYDGRRDLGDSTSAALYYLTGLEQRYDDWLLALAAYNTGPARLSKLLRQNRKAGGNGTYWELKLPRETARYVPKILALRELLIEGSLSSASTKMAHVGSTEFIPVEFSQQVDLLQVARLADLELNQIYTYNAGLNRWATPPDGPHRLWLPEAQAKAVSEGLAGLQDGSNIQWERYTVDAGDSLSEIASAKRSRVAWIKAANNLQNVSIRENQTLLIPQLSNKKQKPGQLTKDQVASLSEKIERLGESIRGHRRVYHEVVAGDSWWKIARQFDTRVAKLTKWNNRKSSDVLRIGERILIWEDIKAFQRESVYRTVYHTVRRGDTLSRLASKHKISVSRIKDWNRLHDQRYIQPGQVLTLHVNLTK